MNKRIENLYNQVRVRKYPFSIEKARLFTEGYKMYEGEPEILRTAKAQAYMLENIPIFLMEGDLIAGSPAAYPMAIEAEFWTRACWTPEGIESLRSETEYIITDEQAEEMYKMSEYWHRYAPDYKMLDLFDEELWAWKHSGFLLPKNKTREESAGMGLAINGLGIFPDAECVSVDHGYVLGKGLQAIIDEAKEELSKAMGVNITSKEDIERIYTLKAMIAINEGVIKWMARYADLAEKQALECQDEKRKAELYSIAETCRRIPGKPAETFQDAITFAWIIFVMVTKMNTTPLGRVDQYLYPYYKHDIEAGILDDEKVLEYLQCYRLKVMQMKSTSGGQHRKKWSGQARWNGVTL
ncbi:MAG: hypothetical protein IJ461_08280, partial [Clostridia bacterium]|nr:hypothetical protein [Clostridia bacterium]